MRYEDGVTRRSFQGRLNHPDLKDQLSIPYRAGSPLPRKIKKNHDPGRIRYLPFFKKMYGRSARQVRKHLVSIRWMPKTVGKRIKITRINGVAARLVAVSRALDKLPAKLRHKYLARRPSAFHWRRIKHTRRLSTHSFGIAVDVAVKHANYWRWDKKTKKTVLRYRNRIPAAIVEIFERHGFIWGGKWYHYDTMHFEYRPELLVFPCVEGRTAKTAFSPTPIPKLRPRPAQR
jgi:hypothetical protein